MMEPSAVLRVADRVLRHYWYSPPLALWRSIEAAAVTTLDVSSFARPILDLGCGDGAFAQHVFPSAVEVGVDLSARALNRAQDGRMYRAVLMANAGELPFASESMGTVFSNSSLEHMDGIAMVLREVERLLRHGGALVFTVPTEELSSLLFGTTFTQRFGLRRSAKWYAARKNAAKYHTNLHGSDWWQRELGLVGLQVKSVIGYLGPSAVRLWDLLDVANVGIGRCHVSGLVRRLSQSFVNGSSSYAVTRFVATSLRPLVHSEIALMLENGAAGSPYVAMGAALIVAVKP